MLIDYSGSDERSKSNLTNSVLGELASDVISPLSVSSGVSSRRRRYPRLWAPPRGTLDVLGGFFAFFLFRLISVEPGVAQHPCPSSASHPLPLSPSPPSLGRAELRSTAWRGFLLSTAKPSYVFHIFTLTFSIQRSAPPDATELINPACAESRGWLGDGGDEANLLFQLDGTHAPHFPTRNICPFNTQTHQYVGCRKGTHRSPAVWWPARPPQVQKVDAGRGGVDNHAGSFPVCRAASEAGVVIYGV